MTTNQRILKAAATVSSQDTLRIPGAGGLLGVEQADKFIDYMIDSSVLLKQATTLRISGDSRQLDTIEVASRLLRKGVEKQAPTETFGVGTGRREVFTTEVILPFDITFQFLEDNIEKDNAEDHVARLMAGTFSNDLEDLGINGNTADAGVDAAFLTIANGWLKILGADPAVNKYDTNNSTDYAGTVFKGMLKALPDRWKRNPRGLVYLTAPSVEEEYRLSLASRQTALGDRQLIDGSAVTYAGIPVKSVPFLLPGQHLLTKTENLVFAIKRAIRIGRQVQERSRLIEYTMTARVGYEIINPELAVYGNDWV